MMTGRARLGLLSGALALAVPAAAQIPQAVIDDTTIPADDDPAQQSAGARLFRMLGDGTELGQTVDDQLEAALTEVRAECSAIERYQVFTRGASFTSMKVKCAGRAVYMLTVGPIGIGVLSGGDRSIDRIDPDEGEVRVLQGEAPKPKLIDVDDNFDRAISVRAGAIALGSLIAAGLVIVALWVRRQKRVKPWRNLKSDDKDQLIAESEEVDVDIYKHPLGVWISKGQRGKRRLFENAFFARLYRDRGIKILQVR